MELEQASGESPDAAVYAEIGDIKESFSYTWNIVYEESSLGHAYEHVVQASPSDVYQVKRWHS